MSKKYQVFVRATTDVEVEADSYEEAERKVLEDNLWYEQLAYNGDVEVDDICEI